MHLIVKKRVSKALRSRVVQPGAAIALPIAVRGSRKKPRQLLRRGPGGGYPPCACKRGVVLRLAQQRPQCFLNGKNGSERRRPSPMRRQRADHGPLLHLAAAPPSSLHSALQGVPQARSRTHMAGLEGAAPGVPALLGGAPGLSITVSCEASDCRALLKVGPA